MRNADHRAAGHCRVAAESSCGAGSARCYLRRRVADPDDLSGRVLGDFVLRERLDEGGFGAVYRCEQPALGREVVVKVLHQRLRGRDAAALRFHREAQLASQFDHPYATPVYAFGIEADDGLLWIAMERVAGVTLEAWLRRQGTMPLEVLVPFFERVAEVVQAAHERGIVHRDLKPANIMLIERAGRLFPKLLDFGVAKLLGEVAGPDLVADEASDSDDLTPADMTLGSPPYMAPEQWSEPGAVGPAADLYALGVIAYEALAGRRPFRGDTRVALAAAHLCGDVPPIGVPGLDAVVGRALAKLPADRYAGALEFAAALRAELEARLLAGVRAAARQWRDRGRPAGLLWRDATLDEVEQWLARTGAGQLGADDLAFVDAALEARTAARRRATWMRRGGVALAIGLAGLAIGVVKYRADTEVRVAQEVAAATALDAEVEQGRAGLLHGEIAEAQQHLIEAHRLGDRTPATAFMLSRALQPLQAEVARFPAAAGRVWAAAWSPDGARVAVADDAGARIWDVATHAVSATLPVGDTVYDVKYSADGSAIATAGAGSVRLWNAGNGGPIRELRGGRAPAPRYYALALSAGLVAAIDARGAVAHVWDASTGAVLAELDCDGSEWPSIGFSADGRWLAAGGGDEVLVYDTRTWARAATLRGPQIRAIAWAPTEARLVTGSSSGDASIWELPGGTRLRRLREVGEPVDAVAWSPDGRLVATGARDGAVQVFGAAGEIVSHGNQLHAKVLGLDFDADSRLVSAAGAGGAVSVTDASTGLPVVLLDGPRGVVRSARFDVGSHRVLGPSMDGTVRIWRAASPYRRWSSAAIAASCRVATSLVPDRRIVAVACPGRATRIWDTAQDQLIAELPPALPPSEGAEPPLPAVTAAGDLAAVARGHEVEIYAVSGRRLLRSVRHSAPVTAVAMDDGTGAVVSGDEGGAVLITRTDLEPALIARGGDAVDALATTSGGRIAVADRGRRIRVINADGSLIAEARLPSRAGLLRPSPDGRQLVIVPDATVNGAPVLWRIGAPEVQVLAGHTGRVFSARWVAGDRILTTGRDGMARMWDANGVLLRAFSGGASYLADATLSPDGTLVVGGDAEGQLRYWDVATSRPLWTTPAHRGAVVGLHFEGEDLITRGFAGDVSRWRITEK